MSGLQVRRPASLAQALARMREAKAQGHDAVWLAGGQSLLAAMRLGMSAPTSLISLQDLSELSGIRTIAAGEEREEAGGGADAGMLEVGAMVTHATVAQDSQVLAFLPGLARLAANIADAQVRNMGTIGGSLANHDPAACWPAGVLACAATLVCSSGSRTADEFFTGLYGTALGEDEVLVAVRFPKPRQFGYFKFEQPASRFALVGAAIARFDDGVRVAVTGLGGGVRRWPEAEAALSMDWSLAALENLSLEPGLAMSDLHASAEYRAHLAAVACRRVLQSLGAPQGSVVARLAGSAGRPDETVKARRAEVSENVPGNVPEEGFGASVLLPERPEVVWAALLDPQVLQRCIPGCESLNLLSPETYGAKLKVGIGPLSARFSGEVLLRDLQPPGQLNLVFSGSAGALGGGQGDTRVMLLAVPGGTRLDWHARVQASGRIAQLGNRLLEGSARKLSDEFFDKLRRELGEGHGSGVDFSVTPAGPAALWQRLLARVKAWLGRNTKEK